ncbi:MAG TPA: hypothetical protein VMZ71_13755 [Gemmataceae bacterium]|nr:hypothetical protein [Gemmataceae bacterium]
MYRVALLCAAFSACAVIVIPNHAPLAAQDKKKAAPKLTLAKVGPIPDAVRTEFKLDAFYGKYTDAGGVPVIASKKVNDRALVMAAWVVTRMTAERPDILKELADGKQRVAVIGVMEKFTDIPEYTVLEGMAGLWDAKSRGAPGSGLTLATTTGEENLLGFPGDPWRGESHLVLVFAQTIQISAMGKLDEKFDGRLKDTYDAAMKKKLWENTHAAKDYRLYWSQGVQSYFDCNQPLRGAPDGAHNGVWNNALLKKYDPALHTLIDETLKSPKWRWGQPLPAK